MLGFKRRIEAESPPVLSVADAEKRLAEARRELAATPWDATRREDFRLAHNALADLSASDDRPLTAH